MKIGFIGVGQMGAGMARNLLRAHHQLTVYNRTREKAEALENEGARLATSPAEAAHGSEAVFTMLADDHAVSEVTFGQNGLISALENTAAHISSSTISLALARRLTEEHAAKGQRFLSACVFGRPEAAENKKLIVVTAGDDATINRYRALFDAIGRATFIAGAEPWHANAVKLCGNFMIASVLETFSEAFATMRKAGIDHHLFLDVMNELFQSPVYKGYGASSPMKNSRPPGSRSNSVSKMCARSSKPPKASPRLCPWPASSATTSSPRSRTGRNRSIGRAYRASSPATPASNHLRNRNPPAPSFGAHRAVGARCARS